ncbi:Ferrous iron transport protein B [Rikenella microfusus]|uniref:Ferrous iron transport protein B n=2 Tax=Rikenella microfusus TaxID=28139 RepID=A0A379MTL0_9BACT|nr:Ferrous iron transport protein B [Rikenella microfusus]
MIMENENTCRRLSELSTAESGVITKVLGHGSFRKRITEMGFIRGKRVTVIKNAPFLDPVEYEIMGYHIALRRSEAELIEVTEDRGTDETAARPPVQVIREDETANRFRHEAGRTINVALVGNPNCGKTSLFNLASGSHERVGNYSGVTVEAKEATAHRGGYTLRLADLPGTYSITEYTPEELYVRRHILEQMPDVVVNVVDASNLERNLFLTTQLIDMNLKVVIALNMYDELTASGAKFDYEALGRMIGIPIVPTVASKGEGIDGLFDRVIAVFEDNEPTVRHIHINYGEDIERSISTLQNLIWQDCDIVAHYSSRYLAIKLLEGDRDTLRLLEGTANFGKIEETVAHETARLEKFYNDRAETVIANARYGFIAGALSETFTPGTADKNRKAARIDRIMTHKIWGFPIFLLLMWAMFQITFSLGEIPMGWIENGVEWLGEWVSEAMPDGSLRDLLVDGVISGVGGVIVFLPQILILFFFISLMEDTGYMARTAFLMDRFMHRIGLHGKSFIPLLMGFGCNVPAIMATRTLESRKDRILTMLIMPFMSCSARLPVYVLLISAFFPDGQGLVLMSVYVIGILVAVLSSLALKRILFHKEEAPFVMELPPYRIPTGRSVVRHMWSKGSQYLRKMGTVILVASILIWALGHYPRPSEAQQAAMASSPEAAAEWQAENSYIGRLGHAIEPAIRPLGFDWKIGVSLLSGLAAKEIVVSTMAVLNNPVAEVSADSAATADGPGGAALTKEAAVSDDTGGDDEEVDGMLVRSLQSQRYASGPKAGEPVYTPLVAYGMMIFILLYFPCIAAIAAIRKEAGWKWAVFTMFYTTGLAWVVSCAIYQIGSRVFGG